MAAPVLDAIRAREISAGARAHKLSEESHERVNRIVEDILHEVSEVSEHGFRRTVHLFECSLDFTRPNHLTTREDWCSDALVLDNVLAELKRFRYKVDWQWSEVRLGRIIITIEW